MAIIAKPKTGRSHEPSATVAAKARSPTPAATDPIRVRNESIIRGSIRTGCGV
jgi:hypothetical protein